MTFTYTGDPSASDLEEVRFLVGDTDSANELLSDEEILFLLAEIVSVAYTAVRAATAIAAKFARFVDVRTGAVSKALGVQMQHYLDLARRLEIRADEGGLGEGGPEPVFTALTRTDKREDRLDSDLVQPQFRIGQDDNPRKLRSRDPDLDPHSIP